MANFNSNFDNSFDRIETNLDTYIKDLYVLCSIATIANPSGGQTDCLRTDVTYHLLDILKLPKSYNHCIAIHSASIEIVLIQVKSVFSRATMEISKVIFGMWASRFSIPT